MHWVVSTKTELLLHFLEEYKYSDNKEWLAALLIDQSGDEHYSSEYSNMLGWS